MYRLHARFSPRRSRWLLLIVCLPTLGQVPGPSVSAASTVEASTTGAPEGALPATTSRSCERASTMDVWKGHFTSSYSPASRTADGYTGAHTSTAEVTVTFGEQQDFGTHVTWRATAVTGSGTIQDKETYHDPRGDEWQKEEGDGPAQHVSGFLKFTRETCTYELNVSVSIEAKATFSRNNTSSTVSSTVIDVELYDIAIATQPPAGADPTLSGNLAVPVQPDTDNPRANQFRADGPGAGRIFTISRDRGAPNAGTANVAWALQPNPLRPRITEVFFRHPTVPEEQWVRVGQNGTVDGNWVQIVARVDSPRETTLILPARVYDVDTGKLLPQCQNIQGIVAPKRVSEISCLWNTEGWAWAGPATGSKNAIADPDHRFRFELGATDDLYGTKEQDVIVRPKPVILVHGLNSNANGWNAYPRMLANRNEYWKAYAVPGMRTGDNVIIQRESNTLLENAKIMHDYVEQVRKLETAQHVDIVAHSMGGLISRAYIHYYMREETLDGGPVAEHLVMLGTPNQGSDCATIGLIMSLRLGLPNVIAPNQLRPGKVGEFNKVVTNRRDVKFSILAGNNHRFLCNPLEDAPSDQFVTEPSAHYVYEDRGWTTSAHTDMTSSQNDVNNWVVPHLAEGRATGSLAGTEPDAAPDSATSIDAETPASLQFSQIVSRTVAAGATVDIPVSVREARALGLTLVTGADMTSSLLDPGGAVVDTITAGSERARQPWQGFAVDQPAAGQWTLRLQNQGTSALPAMLAVMLDSDTLRAVGQVSTQDAEGRVTVQVVVTDHGVAARGATARVTLAHGASGRTTVPLFDDGQHGDGAAGDGLFAAQTAPLAGELHGAIVEAEAGGDVRIVPLEDGNGPLAPPDQSTTVRIFLPAIQR